MHFIYCFHRQFSFFFYLFTNWFPWFLINWNVFFSYFLSFFYLLFSWIDFVGSFSRDCTDGSASRSKRLCSNQGFNGSNLDDSMSRNCHSQPAPTINHALDTIDKDFVTPRNDYCFSQPTLLDDLLLCTQLNATQGSGQTSNPFQRLVRRMTRFFVSTSCEETIKRLTKVLDKLGFTWKLNNDSTITISTIDRRKLQLTFKANLLEMDGKLLLDFRLSKGCGLDFKRKFVKIKDSKDIADIITKHDFNISNV